MSERKRRIVEQEPLEIEVPEYERQPSGLREALERLLDDDAYFGSYDHEHGDATENWHRQQQYRQHIEQARAALAAALGQG